MRTSLVAGKINGLEAKELLDRIDGRPQSSNVHTSSRRTEHCVSVMTLQEIADLLDAPTSKLLKWGNYRNRRGIRGYYQQVKCGPSWCSVSVSDVESHPDGFVGYHTDAIRIPRLTISSALRTAGREDVAVKPYSNRASVEGVWSAFEVEDHWYMVSVSHVNLSAHPTSADLERIAGEFLRMLRRMGREQHWERW